MLFLLSGAGVPRRLRVVISSANLGEYDAVNNNVLWLQVRARGVAVRACPLETRPFSYCVGINQLSFYQNIQHGGGGLKRKRCPSNLLRKKT
jgi:hypothetical protein